MKFVADQFSRRGARPEYRRHKCGSAPSRREARLTASPITVGSALSANRCCRTRTSPWLMPMPISNRRVPSPPISRSAFCNSRRIASAVRALHLASSGHAAAAHVSPNRHDRVADEFIERAVVLEDDRRSSRLRYSFSCLTSASGSAFSVSVVKPTISENRMVAGRRTPRRRAVKAVGVFENLLDEILRNVTLERPAGAQFLDAFQHVFEA